MESKRGLLSFDPPLMEFEVVVDLMFLILYPSFFVHVIGCLCNCQIILNRIRTVSRSPNLNRFSVLV